jgi:hypothetical protein
MFINTRYFLLPLFVAIIILMSGIACSSAQPVQTPSQINQTQTAKPAAEQNSSSSSQASSQSLSAGSETSITGNAVKAPDNAKAVNRVDVIYFHVNQRCVTCLCFEKRVNHLIEANFSGLINSGKLTYQVLNAQLPQNAAIARKYGAVGSQLFINTIINGVDNIEDIENIWNWNCNNNPGGFELKVKNAIEQRLTKLGQGS